MLKLGDTKPEIFKLQKDLFSLGFYKGNFSGTFDEDTLQAVKQFQSSKFVTGVMTTPLLKILESEVSKNSQTLNISNVIRRTLSIKIGRDADLFIHRPRGVFSPELIILESSNSVSPNIIDPFHSYHFRVDRSGDIRSFVDLDKAAIHSSGSFIDFADEVWTNINERSICIQLENVGRLYYNKGMYYYDKDFKRLYDHEVLGTPLCLNESYFQPFTHEQIRNTVKLIKEIEKHYAIKRVSFKNELIPNDPHIISVALPKGKFDYEYNSLPITTTVSY